MKIHRLIPAAVLLALAAPAAQAQAAKAKKPTGDPARQTSPSTPPAAAQPSSRLMELDANHDGKVDRSEWKGNAVSFQMLDRNGDGALSGDEVTAVAAPTAEESPAAVAARRQARQERIFRWMDTNHDSRVTEAEWREDKAKFQRLDRNHDGVVTLQEMEGK
jgi:5-hydroxyisourate hydrolase-like protein (transthyretin family)